MDPICQWLYSRNSGKHAVGGDKNKFMGMDEFQYMLE
jgi:hypothetical protein